ncbi:hypothetical protein VDGE_21461 [Verticillium dahliae]|uniref:Uncharacterized protein n=1 Tax=Verticillium dahliae TaxID=27337 RepID=A0A444RZE8_VERDA|nr:hypothetical protein VDGE_21461 [Verticillium dahliae]
MVGRTHANTTANGPPKTIVEVIRDRNPPQFLFKEEPDQGPRDAPRSSISESAGFVMPVLAAVKRDINVYIDKYKCSYDSKSMVLLKFSALDIHGRSTIRGLFDQKVGQWCEATFIPLNDSDDPEFKVKDETGSWTGGQLAMQALLSFHLEAMEDTPHDEKDGTLGV